MIRFSVCVRMPQQQNWVFRFGTIANSITSGAETRLPEVTPWPVPLIKINLIDHIGEWKWQLA